MKTSPTSKTFIPSRAASWSSEDLRTLRALVEQGCSAQAIAARLRRTVSSVRNKVLMQGLSLSVRPAVADYVEPLEARS